ncbi:MAG: hypothetical protein ACQES1_10620 [Bacteroidota bacterium]
MLVGNDIVALHEKHNLKSFNRPGYVMKFSFLSEQEQCNNIETNSIAFLWSIKESAYKLIQKYLTLVPFNPKHFQLTSCNQFSDTIINSSIEYTPQKLKLSALTHVNNEYIHTMAVLNQKHIKQVHYQIIKYPAKASQQEISQEIRNALIQNVSSDLCLNPSEKVSITKNEQGIPRLLLSNGYPPDISISHDGEFGAYAYLSSHQKSAY